MSRENITIVVIAAAAAVKEVVAVKEVAVAVAAHMTRSMSCLLLSWCGSWWSWYSCCWQLILDALQVYYAELSRRL